MSTVSPNNDPSQLSSREIELRVYDIDPNEIADRLQVLGAVCLGAVSHKRAVIDVSPVNPNRWIRVRTDGVTTTLAVKERFSHDADGTGEHEVTVSDYDETLKILSAIGSYTPRSIQETRRTSYTLHETEVSIDEWPTLGHIVEMEGTSEAQVHEIGAKLGFTADDMTGKSVEEVYAERHGIDVKTTHLTFDDVQ